VQVQDSLSTELLLTRQVIYVFCYVTKVLLTTPTTPKDRMKAIVEASEGFVYLVRSLISCYLTLLYFMSALFNFDVPFYLSYSDPEFSHILAYVIIFLVAFGMPFGLPIIECVF